MGMNATQFAEKYGKNCRKKVKAWYEAGYLQGATKNIKTGIYDIPEDMPLPYAANKRISKVPSLWKEILKAAESQSSIYASMYPKIHCETFDAAIESLAGMGCIEEMKTQTGATYLVLCTQGYLFMNQLSETEQTQILEKFLKVAPTGIALMEDFPVAVQFIQQLQSVV
ncbi:MAG: hypothetical protein R3Y62_05265 [Eubacteriales bacterium]